mgnify:CR=1 FL=1|jgi:hypothetical protein
MVSLFGHVNNFYYFCVMKEKLKTHRLVGIDMSNQKKLVEMGKLKQKGLANDAYWSMGKSYYWVKRGNKI